MYYRYGVRNSLLLAPMPTASTAQILGNNESIEAYTNNIYTRRVLSGEFQVSDNIFTQNCILGTLANSVDPDEMQPNAAFHQGLHYLPRSKPPSETEIHHDLENITCDPLKLHNGLPHAYYIKCYVWENPSEYSILSKIVIFPIYFITCYWCSIEPSH